MPNVRRGNVAAAFAAIQKASGHVGGNASVRGSRARHCVGRVFPHRGGRGVLGRPPGRENDDRPSGGWPVPKLLPPMPAAGSRDYRGAPREWRRKRPLGSLGYMRLCSPWDFEAA